ncbi:hypothetical protein IQ22_03481 [Pseudomonas duriflava]|uniref:YCII-related domain-containing protein n=1 Tax=Pseudomonas duriflava TaxID=459528 RepID=A0A562Q6K2_9PSED|nr:YciI family protein [Pseudomonas duriflava]TWI52338.1 hypothetical protein IQ22_03481 [Pseudomonas duriflava]
MQFAVTAYDYTDPDALDRRMACCQAHLDGIRAMAKEGIFISGGAILDDQGRMIGSSVHLDFPDREALELWLQSEPYMKGRVWEKLDIREVKLVDIRN